MVVLGRGAVSYERGTPVAETHSRADPSRIHIFVQTPLGWVHVTWRQGQVSPWNEPEGTQYFAAARVELSGAA